MAALSELDTSATLYGIQLRLRGGSVRNIVPDEDDDLLGTGDGPPYVDANDRDRVLSLARRYSDGEDVRSFALITITRTQTFEVPAAPLPTIPGALVRATVSGNREVYFLTEDRDGAPWRSQSGDWAGPEDLEDVEIVFDAES